MSYVKHRLTNATTEAINSQIETLWKAACGFRNKKRFRTIILFHFGGLDLYPGIHRNPGRALHKAALYRGKVIRPVL